MAVRWITGFNGLAYQNNKINPYEFPSPNCRLCEQIIEETSQHLICECPALHHERVNAFKTIHCIETLYEVKIPNLLTFLKERRVQLMENISEYPLLFVEDYTHLHNEIIDIINHETSLPSCDDRDDRGQQDEDNGDQPGTGSGAAEVDEEGVVLHRVAEQLGREDDVAAGELDRVGVG